jgi:hypothetical protein
MSFLKGRTVRIIVSEPPGWAQGNLFGTIIYDRGGEQIIVKLSNEIKGLKVTSNLLKLSPCYENATFKPLTQDYSMMVGGELIKENSSEFEYVLNGIVSID